MKMYVKTTDSMKDLEAFINDKKISKEQIVGIFQDKDGTYTVSYFVEE